MSDTEKQSSDVVMVTIAWAQFLAMAAVIDKADMRNLRSAGEQVLSSPWLWQWDWTKFGGVAIALNILATCLLIVPALAQSSGWQVFEGRPKETRNFLHALRCMGFYAWLFSFMAFIGYLNFASVICFYVAMAVIVLLGFYFRFFYSEPQ